MHLLNLLFEKTDSSGDLSGGETPGPIPNPEVKPASADGTGGTHRWESRSSPGGICFFSSKSAQKIARQTTATAIFSLARLVVADGLSAGW